MKILYILHETTRYSGANKSFINLHTSLIANGISSVIICPNKNGIAQDLIDKGCNVIILNYTYNIRPEYKGIYNLCLFLPRLIKRKLINHLASINLRKICYKIKPDIIHSNTSVINIGANAANKLGIPHITHIREYGDKDHQMHIYGISKQLHNKNSYSIAITKDISKHRNLLYNPYSRVIYNGIITENKIHYNDIKYPYFLYAGRIDQTKGVTDLIDAYIKYSQSTEHILKLKLAGDYSGSREITQQELVKRLENARIAHLVEWLGERDDIDQLMSHATATIIPSYFEGFGRIMAEAIANGSLVIGRNTAGTKEQFDNGLELTQNEIGIRFTTIDELTKVMIEVSNKDIKNYRDTITHAQDTIRGLYTTEICEKQVYSFYKDILTKY